MLGPGLGAQPLAWLAGASGCVPWKALACADVHTRVQNRAALTLPKARAAPSHHREVWGEQGQVCSLSGLRLALLDVQILGGQCAGEGR